MTTLKDDNFIGQRCQISCDSESMVEVDGKLIPEFFFPYDSNIFTCEDNEKNEAQWDRAIPSCVQYDIWKRGGRVVKRREKPLALVCEVRQLRLNFSCYVAA